MSKLSFAQKTALVAAAGFNDGANKGFWRKQWRDRLGKWAEMGRGIDFKMQTKSGVVDGHGVFIGGTDKPGFGRVMVEGQENNGLPSGVYHIASANGQEYAARLPEGALKDQGIELKDTMGNNVGDRQASDIQSLEGTQIDPITEEDRKLSKEAPNPEQAKLIQQERDNSPVAKLPAGSESRLSSEELQNLMQGDSTATDAKDSPEASGWSKGEAGRNRPGQTYYYTKVGNVRLGAYTYQGENTVQVNGENFTNYYDNWSDFQKDLPNFLEQDKKMSIAEAKSLLKPYDTDGSLSKMIDNGANGTDIATALLSNEDWKKDSQIAFDSNWADNRTREENAAHSRTGNARSAQFVLDRFAPEQNKGSKEDAIAADLFKAAITGNDLPTIDSLESKLQDKGSEPDDKFQMDPWLYQITPGSEIDYNDYVVNPENSDQILKVKDFNPSDMDGATEVLNVVGVDENGNEVTFKLPENKEFRKVMEWKAKPNSTQVDSTPKDIAPENAVYVALKDLQAGDKFYNESGDLMGTVDSTEPAKDPEKIKVNYTNASGEKKLVVSYGENTYATDRKPEDNAQAPEAAPAEQPTPTETPAVEAPAEPTPAVEAPAEPTPIQEVAPTPEAPVEPKPTPTNVKPKPRANDTGKLIPRPKFTEGQLNQLRKTKLEGLVDDTGAAVLEYDSNGKPYQPKDPNAMLNFLAKVYPNAKFNDQGQLVLMRQVSNENGKKIQWEIRAANSGDKKIIYMFNFKDLNTGQEETLIHKDARDSVQALLGKTNSPEMLADILTGIETRKFGRFDTANARDILERAHYFTLQGRTKNIRDLVNHYANGFAARFNPKNGTQLEAEVKSLFDSFWAGDSETTRQRMLAVFGRIPMDKQSHAIARKALRDMFRDRYPHESGRKFGALVSTASATVRGQQFDTPETRAIPYSSANKVDAVEEGMTVEYTNNIGEKSVLKVIARQKVNTANPTQSGDIFDYGDYVTVQDMNGVQSSLPTTKLAILKDQKTPLTAYKGRVQGRRLREARGFTYNPTQLRFPDQPSIPDRVMLVDDLTPGDSFYGKGGNNLGHIVEVVPITGKDDKPGYGIMYIDGNGDIHKVAVASGEKRGPNVQISDAKKSSIAEPTPAAETPVGKVINSNTDESDPDFDLESIQFTTDPNTVEKPKSVGLDFNLPSNAVRRSEEQLQLNEQIQAEIDQMTAGLTTAMGPNWTYDKSSFQASSFYSAAAFDELVAKAKESHPDLSESQIRTLLELQHAKASGYFAMSKDQIMDRIFQEAATYSKADGVVQKLQIDVAKTKDGQIELAVTPEEKAKYDQALSDIENFASNAKMGPLFDPQKHNIRIVNGSGKFADLYKSAGWTTSTRGQIANQVLGVNISMPTKDDKKTVSILINNSLLRSGAGPEGFVNPIGDTLTHEFGHTVHRTLEDSSFYGGPYAKAFKEYITRYGKSKQEEHFAESFSKYIQTGQSTPTFFQFLQSVGLA